MNVKENIKQMTLEEKCFLLSGKDFWSSRSVEHAGVPQMTLSDGPHGLRKQEGAGDQLGLNGSVPATCFPTAVTMANSWDPNLGEEMGKYLGEEAVDQDVCVLLGPGMNMKRSPLCGRNFEYFSEDPYLAGKMAAGYVQGIQSKGISACPKHFAANNTELRRQASDSVVDERPLREIYLTAFEIAVKESHPKGMMSSYNMVNEVYTNENAHLLQEILRDEWGFDGFVVSDWGAGNDFVEGVRAGSHLEMPTTGGDSGMQNAAVELAKKADYVLLYLGLDEISESEGLDRSHMRLPQSQIDLLGAISEANPNVIIVMSAGSSIEMPWLDECKALVHGYLCGQAGASAMLDVILGNVNPSGKLTETYPHKYEDMPSAPYFPVKERTVEYREGPYIGYRYFETANVPVLFPFGYGLSYTTFEYSDLQVTHDKVTFVLSNIGDRDGAEIAQLYVSAKCDGVFRPVKELKGFKKVFLKAGESQTVEIPLDDKAFRYFNVKTNQFEVESGTYEILIGASVQDIKLSGTIEVQGTDAPLPYDMSKLPSYASGDIKNVSDGEYKELLGHDIPDGHWSGTLQMNDAICQLYYAKSWTARIVYHVLTSMLNSSIKKGKPDLNIIFIYNMPFRAIGKMAGGSCSQEMCEGIVDMVNGHLIHLFRGLGTVISGFFCQNRRNKEANKMK